MITISGINCAYLSSTKSNFKTNIFFKTGSLSMVALLSSVIVTFLCLRLRKQKSGDNSDTLDLGGARQLRGSKPENNYVIGGTSADILRPRMSVRSEYVHSTQARIP
jgi:hypothetical protein